MSLKIKPSCNLPTIIKAAVLLHLSVFKMDASAIINHQFANQSAHDRHRILCILQAAMMEIYDLLF